MSTTTKRTGGTIEISPRNPADQSACIVLSHGLGDTAEGWADVAEHLASKMPYIKFILPTAPTQPVSMNGGFPMPSWYDITGLDERSNENCEGISESKNTILQLLQAEHSRGLPYSRMMLAGFSQGGALSLFVGLQMPSVQQKLAGIVAMSGYLPGAKQFNLTPGLEETPVLHAHGTADPVVRFELAQKSKEFLKEKGVTNYEVKSYAGMVHSACPEEIEDIRAFIERVLPHDLDSCIKPKNPSEMSVKELREAIRNAGLGSKAVGLMEKQEFVKLLQDHQNGKL